MQIYQVFQCAIVFGDVENKKDYTGDTGVSDIGVLSVLLWTKTWTYKELFFN